MVPSQDYIERLKNPQPNKQPTNSSDFTGESLCNLNYSDELLLNSSINWNFSDIAKFCNMYAFPTALFCLILSPFEKKKSLRISYYLMGKRRTGRKGNDNLSLFKACSCAEMHG